MIGLASAERGYKSKNLLHLVRRYLIIFLFIFLQLFKVQLMGLHGDGMLVEKCDRLSHGPLRLLPHGVVLLV